MISVSTWFDPYVLEVVVIPLTILLGTLSAWFTKKVLVGPIVHVTVTMLFNIWIWLYFYSGNSSTFFTIHLNSFEFYIIEIIFVGVTCVLSWGLLRAKRG
ncbi:hypothetical protein AWH56_023135 [Anaerobacillus isosaccharinicus]|uniref:CAAX protease family protein n=1 Tax=Anaerobacillus isosaccharinicus TaxID=1532552 RepID=A0A1S2LII8_9BACI|nr:hypothetical protein [Anaerobacillus isosaccharinicus]MBA5586201.1 hypothetical protein [Anaerobacillus isosaccharinicus]QOY35538.1 hypothetical protein AWH56_023135 [Anaerobacillus isosaccharinicus]